MTKKRVMFISSTGGHLKELLQLKKMFDKYDYSLITEKTKSNLYLKDEYGKRVHFLIYGTKHHFLTYPFKLLANCFISLYYYLKTKPDYIITTGNLKDEDGKDMNTMYRTVKKEFTLLWKG